MVHVFPVFCCFRLEELDCGSEKKRNRRKGRTIDSPSRVCFTEQKSEVKRTFRTWKRNDQRRSRNCCSGNRPTVRSDGIDVLVDLVLAIVDCAERLARDNRRRCLTVKCRLSIVGPSGTETRTTGSRGRALIVYGQCHSRLVHRVRADRFDTCPL